MNLNYQKETTLVSGSSGGSVASVIKRSSEKRGVDMVLLRAAAEKYKE